MLALAGPITQVEITCRVTRIHRHRGTCPHCRRGSSAAPPVGMPPGSPFGPDLTALIDNTGTLRSIERQAGLKLR